MSDLEIEDGNRIRTLTLSRESALNAFDNSLYHALASALDEANSAPNVAVAILTGKGRAFSAGQDMAEMADIGQEMAAVNDGNSTGAAGAAGFPHLIDVLEGFSKPLIAAVNGLGVGLGFTILAHCDLVLMSDTAKLRVPFCPLGVAPEAASSVLLPELVGWQEAAWILFSGEWVTAQEAVELGVAWRLCPADELLAEAQVVAAKIARWPIPSLVATKSAMVAGRIDRVRAARRVEDAAFTNLIGSPANVEAVAAFLEKRVPDFSGIDGA